MNPFSLTGERAWADVKRFYRDWMLDVLVYVLFIVFMVWGLWHMLGL